MNTTKRDRETAELGRLALLLAAVGLCLAFVTVHGALRTNDTPFPTITRTPVTHG